MRPLDRPLRIGIVGAGFISRFHLQSFLSIRDAQITAVASRTRKSAGSVAQLARDLGVGDPTVHRDLGTLLTDPAVDAIWLLAPNFLRVEMVEEIADAARRGRTGIRALAIEKPLARNVREARRVVSEIRSTRLLHGYLENIVFCPSVARPRDLLWARGAARAGRPYLARATEEHAGPHSPWFWRGKDQGGGVVNDMMCHSIECVRFLLSSPDPKDGPIVPKTVNAQIATLKWNRPEYAAELKRRHGPSVDYRRTPSEDFGRASIAFADREGRPLLAECSDSWCYVGAGLRTTIELQGPEYSMMVNTANAPTQIFLSRALGGQAAGEDFIEKQNSELGLMPVMEDETLTYGYVHENRHMVAAFRAGVPPKETLDHGLLVTELLMTCYMSAEKKRTLAFPPAGLEKFIPRTARGQWNPADILKA